MYGLPNDFKFNLLVGHQIEQICINLNQVSFQFDRDLRITTETTYAFQSKFDGCEIFLEVPSLDENIKLLFGSEIVKAEGNPDGTLILVFENGQKLKFLDTSCQYESYTIDQNGISTIV